MLFGT
ncbi:hypothetical protein F383_34421 [Gossypium arboreum]